MPSWTVGPRWIDQRASSLPALCCPVPTFPHPQDGILSNLMPPSKGTFTALSLVFPPPAGSTRLLTLCKTRLSAL